MFHRALFPYALCSRGGVVASRPVTTIRHIPFRPPVANSAPAVAGGCLPPAKPLAQIPVLARCFSSSRLHWSPDSSSNAGSSKPPKKQVQIVRFADEIGEEHFGVFEDGDESKAYVVQQHAGGRLVFGDAPIAVGNVLPPVSPPAIWAVGLNYRKHAAEVGLELPKEPVVFMKSTSSLTGHRSAIVIPSFARDPPQVDFEAELAVVIGKPCYRVPPEEAANYIIGYTIANDVSARRWQKKQGQWSLCKSFDTFTPLGPFLTPPSKFDASNLNLKIELSLNGEVMQSSNTSDMIFSVAEIISFLSQGMTLEPGTVILTGTPEGVGFTRKPPRYLKKGDTVSITIEGLGTLTNYVAEENEWGATEM